MHEAASQVTQLTNSFDYSPDRLVEPQRAITLRQGIANGYVDYGWMRNDPDLAALPSEPDFVALTGR